MPPRQFFRLWWRYIVGPASITALFYFSINVGPAWSAHLGEGEKGTWTVTAIIPGSKGGGGTWLGTFTSNDDTDVRTDVRIESVTYYPGVGGNLSAIDTGADDVFPLGGGPSWWEFSIATTVVALLCAAWAWTFPVAVVRRELERRRTVESPEAV